MSLNIVVPELGESIVDARVAKWLKQKGDRVEVGDALVELETDKINLEVPAPGTGVLESIAQPDGADVKIGEVLGTIAEQAKEAAADAVAAAAAVQPRATPPPSTPALESPSARRAAREREKAAADEKRTERKAEPAETQPPPKGDKTAAGSDAPPIVAPPTVPQTVTEKATVVARPVEPGLPREERIRMSKRRATIASRLVQAQHTAAMLTTFNEADMTGVMELRERHKAGFTEKHGASIGITTFFVKAAVVALAEFPRLNAEVQGDEMVLKHHFDIGVAVGAPEGLVVPVLHNADQLSFVEINSQIRDLAHKATTGTLALDDLRGGTFSITNGGVYGSLLSTPILNPPQVGILGMHAIQRRPVDVNGQIVSKPMMYLALTYDHRIVDGEEAVRFLVRIKQLVEDPGRLLIES